MNIFYKKLYLYNSLSKKKELFKAIDPGKVGMYVCGPTVYNEVHLGNCRTFITFDILFRYLKHLGYKVTYVRNITDVGHLENDLDEGEDKIAKRAKFEKVEPMEIANKYTYSFHKVIELFNLLPPSIEPRATGHILEQIKLIEKLISKNLAYEINGSVYFDLQTYNQKYSYGLLSNRKIKELISNSREELKNQDEKKNPFDFALWKRADSCHIMHWHSPWGEGFPGWHLECSAMSKKYLGKNFDIHGGGLDLKFPHHECELAQGMGAFGSLTANYWLHSNILKFEGEKMSKSKGNVLLPKEMFFGGSNLLSKEFDPMVIRFFILQAHYRSELNFSNEALLAAQKAYKKLIEVYFQLDKIPLGKESTFDVSNFIKNCYENINEDLNTALLIGELFKISKLISSVNRGEDFLNEKDRNILKEAFENFFFEILGFKPIKKLKKKDSFFSQDHKKFKSLVDFLINLRAQAREAKNWKLADEIRNKLFEIGIEIKDLKTNN